MGVPPKSEARAVSVNSDAGLWPEAGGWGGEVLLLVNWEPPGFWFLISHARTWLSSLWHQPAAQDAVLANEAEYLGI